MATHSPKHTICNVVLCSVAVSWTVMWCTQVLSSPAPFNGPTVYERQGLGARLKATHLGQSRCITGASRSLLAPHSDCTFLGGVYPWAVTSAIVERAVVHIRESRALASTGKARAHGVHHAIPFILKGLWFKTVRCAKSAAASCQQVQECTPGATRWSAEGA